MWLSVEETETEEKLSEEKKKQGKGSQFFCFSSPPIFPFPLSFPTLVSWSRFFRQNLLFLFSLRIGHTHSLLFFDQLLISLDILITEGVTHTEVLRKRKFIRQWQWFAHSTRPEASFPFLLRQGIYMTRTMNRLVVGRMCVCLFLYIYFYLHVYEDYLSENICNNNLHSISTIVSLWPFPLSSSSLLWLPKRERRVYWLEIGVDVCCIYFYQEWRMEKLYQSCWCSSHPQGMRDVPLSQFVSTSFLFPCVPLLF